MTKVELGVLSAVPVEVVVFVLVVAVVDEDVLFPKTFEFVELVCNNLYSSVLFVFPVPEVTVVELDVFELLAVLDVTVLLLVTVLALPLDSPPFPPLPLPFPTPIPLPVTDAPSVVLFCFLGFLHVVLILTLVSTDEASVHCC